MASLLRARQGAKMIYADAALWALAFMRIAYEHQQVRQVAYFCWPMILHTRAFKFDASFHVMRDGGGGLLPTARRC